MKELTKKDVKIYLYTSIVLVFALPLISMLVFFFSATIFLPVLLLLGTIFIQAIVMIIMYFIDYHIMYGVWISLIKALRVKDKRVWIGFFIKTIIYGVGLFFMAYFLVIIIMQNL